MKIKELYAALEERISRDLSCEWDNDGLMCCADPEREVSRILVALDVTARVVEQAISGGYDLILSHHPLVFRPLKSLQPENPVAKKCIRLLLAGVTVMSFHTRLDAVCGGVNDTLAAKLGLTDTVPFGENGETIGRIGCLPAPMSLSAFAELVKQATGAPCVTAADGGREVYRVALLGGSGSDDVGAAERAGADTYLTGELAHHHLADAPEHGVNLLSAGHYHTEAPVCETLCGMLLEIDRSLTVDITDSNEILVF